MHSRQSARRAEPRIHAAADKAQENGRGATRSSWRRRRGCGFTRRRAMTRYLDFAVTNWWRTTDYLYDKDEHLFFRDSTFFNKTRGEREKSFLEPRQRLGDGRPRPHAAIPADEPSRPSALRAIVQGHGGKNPDAASSRTDSGARACSTRRVIRPRKPAARAFSPTRSRGA